MSPSNDSPGAWWKPTAVGQMPDGVVAIGGDLEPVTLLAGYRMGMFPMPVKGWRPMAWWSPDPRGVIPFDRFVPSRSLRQSIRKYRTTVDRCFRAVLEGCADPARPHGWITPEVADAYTRLHALGWAHSVEVWEGNDLVGGLYGVAIGAFFSGESMFHRARDASKVALARLVELLEPYQEAVLDVQWATPHLVSLGAVEIKRADYMRRLTLAVASPGPFADGADRHRGTLARGD